MIKEKTERQTRKNTSAGNYPIGDFLIRVKNASLARNHEIVVTNSKLVESVAHLLEKEGYLEGIKKEKGKLSVRLSYRKKEPVILGLKLVSSPGLRVYKGVFELEKKKGPSTFIVSTPKGIMSAMGAIKKRLGGEVIAEIW